jgi:hypothetical protein
MPYLTKDDLKTHIYADIINEIIRNDDTIADEQIEAAISEASAYLAKYDLTQLFSDTVTDKNLKNKIKDIACWNIIKLANPNIEMQLFENLYKSAISFFKDIQKGQADPAGWPYKTVSQDNPTPVDSSLTSDVNGTVISWSSNRKRHNHF